MWSCVAEKIGGGDDGYALPDNTATLPDDAVTLSDIVETITELFSEAIKSDTAKTEDIFTGDDLSDAKLPETKDTYEQKEQKEYVAAALSDYVKGAVALFNDSFPKNAKIILDENIVGSDIVLRGFGSTLAVVNRYGGDQVQLFDAESDFSLFNAFFTGGGSNPQDALLASGGLYTTVYATKDYEGNPIKIDGNPIGDVLIFDPDTGNIKSQIDLTPYSKNNQPNSSIIIEAEGKIYTIVQDLNMFTPDTNGKLIVINPSTNQVITKIDLNGFNPVDMIYAEQQGKLFIACAGDFMSLSETNAGIEAIDIANQKTLGLIMKEDAIGNNATKVRVISDQLGVIATSNFNISDISFVASFNPQTGEIIDKIYGSGTSNVMDILADKNGVLWIADRDGTGDGVICIDPKTGEILDPMTTLAMPPVSLATLKLPE